LVTVLGSCSIALTAKSGNMNGKYAVSSKGDIGVAWNDDYASKGYEYFDVWAPEIATHYGEVFWTDQGSTPLPPDIVKRFDGKVIAIQGYEQDQVMVTPTGNPGQNPEKDVSVPINWAYNHHYCAWMTGKQVEMKERPTDLLFDGDAYASGAHGKTTMMVPVEKEDAEPREFEGVAQTSWFISEGNGGESRKSFHGYPQGYAQLLESPTSWHITPMQIDTRNREHGVTPADVHKCTNMTECAGYEPRQARYGRNWGGLTKKNANVDGYSGILECPCNSRYGGDPEFYPTSKTKVLSRSFSAIPSGTCKQGESFPKAENCYNAIALLGFNVTKLTNATASEKDAPHGCVLVRNADGSGEALYNTGGNTSSDAEGCASSIVKVAQSGSPSTKVNVAVELNGAAAAGVATITLSGPASGWFAVGLDAKLMHDNPYTLVVNDKGVTERKLGTCGTEADHCAGTLLNASITLVSSAVVDGVRTAVFTRPFAGATKDHYTFAPTKVGTLNYISAVGSSQEFAYHKNRDIGTMSFTPLTGPTCICDLGETGSLCETNGTACNSFVKNCVSRSSTLGNKGEASGDLLADHNPTCSSGQYVGGLSCCSHKRIILDDDQVVPPELLKYHMKFRFWYQEYKPETKVSNASHVDLSRIYFTTEANAGEYDIPPAFYTGDQPKIAGYPQVGPYPELTPGSTCTGNCPSGDDCECTHTITYNHTVSNMRLIYASGHCHAPACIGIWLYRNDPGHEMELLCHQAPIYGNGTGTNSESGIYDEAGYLSLPPCLFADEPGLHPSVLLPPNTELVSIKKNRNTHMGHFGEMASWQCRGLGV